MARKPRPTLEDLVRAAAGPEPVSRWADKAGLNRSSLYRWMRPTDRSRIYGYQFTRLAAALGVSEGVVRSAIDATRALAPDS